MPPKKQLTAARATSWPGSTIPSEALPVGPALRARNTIDLHRRISAELGGKLDLVLTDNRAVMVSVKRDPRRRRFDVRLHHVFAEASDDVISTLGRYIRGNDREASLVLNRYIETHSDRIRPPFVERRRKPRPRTQGRFYDLQAFFDALNVRYFEGQGAARITWGRQQQRGRVRHSVRLGSFTLEENLIRIHPGLDQPWIPPYYLAWVIYHEMLHAQQPVARVNGRHRFHTPDFAAQEQRFAEYEEASAWERSHLAALLRI